MGRPGTVEGARRLAERLAAHANRLPLPRRPAALGRAVLLTGSPRSGTTWLGQVLASSPGYCLVNEPLNLKMPGVREAGFTWRPYRPPGAEWPEGEGLLRARLEGRGVTLKLVRRNGWKALSCGGVVLKEVRANRLLPWLAGTFPGLRMVLIVRHPCAVVSSQLAYPRLRRAATLMEDDERYLVERLPSLVGWARRLRTAEEQHALTWALDQHAPRAAPPPPAWFEVSYERLVLHGKRELDALLRALRLPASAEAANRLRTPSWQARRVSVDHTRASARQRLEVWKHRLDAAAVQRILDVVGTCGITGFGEDPVPAELP